MTRFLTVMNEMKYKYVKGNPENAPSNGILGFTKIIIKLFESRTLTHDLQYPYPTTIFQQAALFLLA